MSTIFMIPADLESKIRKDYKHPESATFTLFKESEALKKKLYNSPFARGKGEVQKAFDSKASYVWIVAIEETVLVPQRNDPRPVVVFYEYHTKNNRIKKILEIVAAK